MEVDGSKYADLINNFRKLEKENNKLQIDLEVSNQKNSRISQQKDILMEENDQLTNKFYDLAYGGSNSVELGSYRVSVDVEGISQSTAVQSAISELQSNTTANYNVELIDVKKWNLVEDNGWDQSHLEEEVPEEKPRRIGGKYVVKFEIDAVSLDHARDLVQAGQIKRELKVGNYDIYNKGENK